MIDRFKGRCGHKTCSNLHISATHDLQDRKPLGELPEKTEKLWKEVDECLEAVQKDEEHHEQEFVKATLVVILVLWCL